MLAEAGAVVLSLDPIRSLPSIVSPRRSKRIYGSARRARQRARALGDARHAPLYVAGEEAGGNLAAALALMARDRRGPKLAGQILLSPMLDACLGTYSLRAVRCRTCRLPLGRWLGRLSRLARQGRAPLCGARLHATRLADIAPALLISAQDDPMRDEAASYAKRLQEAGVTVRHHVQTAPTQWPDAYAGAPVEGSCLCKACHHVTDFYALTAPP
jgi:acetyl esterase